MMQASQHQDLVHSVDCLARHHIAFSKQENTLAPYLIHTRIVSDKKYATNEHVVIYMYFSLFTNILIARIAY